jgi:hypothetical protein
MKLRSCFIWSNLSYNWQQWIGKTMLNWWLNRNTTSNDNNCSSRRFQLAGDTQPGNIWRCPTRRPVDPAMPKDDAVEGIIILLP